jgi:hypothetical protein
MIVTISYTRANEQAEDLISTQLGFFNFTKCYCKMVSTYSVLVSIIRIEIFNPPNLIHLVEDLVDPRCLDSLADVPAHRAILSTVRSSVPAADRFRYVTWGHAVYAAVLFLPYVDFLTGYMYLHHGKR